MYSPHLLHQGISQELGKLEVAKGDHLVHQIDQLHLTLLCQRLPETQNES